METVLAVCIPSTKAQAFRADLEKLHLWDKTRRLQKINVQTVVVPVKCSKTDLLPVLETWSDAAICNQILPPSKIQLLQTPFEKLKAAISKLLEKNCLSESLLEELPQKWEQHGDLILIPNKAFISPLWLHLGHDLWITVARALSCKRIARYSPIADNGFRSSQVALLLGNDGKVVHTDNGIQYTYDVTKCMFSAGNITEKLRVAQFDCRGQVVLDLFSGIGYFTLPYLVHAKADHVHACEWNPDAVAALRETLLLNGVADKCTIHEGDNKKLCLTDIADRVNLGLIPSSQESWPVAVKVLKPSGGYLHVHGNAPTNHSIFSPTDDSSNNADKSIGVDNSQLLPSSSSFHCIKNDNGSLKQSCVESDKADSDTCDSVLVNRHSIVGSNFISTQPLEHILPATAHWASQVASEILGLLCDIKGGKWTVHILHIEKVKSYAPYIDHVVVDLEYRPLL